MYNKAITLIFEDASECTVSEDQIQELSGLTKLRKLLFRKDEYETINCTIVLKEESNKNIEIYESNRCKITTRLFDKIINNSITSVFLTNAKGKEIRVYV